MFGAQTRSEVGQVVGGTGFECRAKRAACALLAVNDRAPQVGMAWAARGR